MKEKLKFYFNKNIALELINQINPSISIIGIAVLSALSLGISGCTSLGYADRRSDYLPSIKNDIDNYDKNESAGWPGYFVGEGEGRCKSRHGIADVPENSNQDSQAQNFSNIPTFLRYMIQRSGCFTVVDRGDGFSTIDSESKLFGRNISSNIIPIEYVIVPKIIYQHVRSTSILPGAGAAYGDSARTGQISLFGDFYKIQTEVKIVLIMTRVSDGVQVFAEEGTSINSEYSLGSAGTTAFNSTTFFGKGATYALAQAYGRLVHDLDATSSKLNPN